MIIKLKDLLTESFISEKMTYKQLLAASEQGRIDRSQDVSVKPLTVNTENGREAWKFSYKSNPSTTGNRHKGYIYFFKEDIQNKESFGDINCSVACSCPDYCYRIAYNNKKKDADASNIVPANILKNNGASPASLPQVNGICKHLISLHEYLNTEIQSKSGNNTQQQQQTSNAPQEPDKVKPLPSQTNLFESGKINISEIMDVICDGKSFVIE
jgi:hypothetical protein